MVKKRIVKQNKIPPMMRNLYGNQYNLISISNKSKPRQKPIRSSFSSSSLFRKERINQKRLSRYGDVDMDGSPNRFDCDPRKVNKDGRIWDAIKSTFSSIPKESSKYSDKEKAKILKEYKNISRYFRS